MKITKENELLKMNNKINQDKFSIELYNKAIEDSIKLKYNIKKINIQTKENKKLKDKNKEISKEIEKLKNYEVKYNNIYLNNIKLHKKYSMLLKKFESNKIKNNVLINKIEQLNKNIINKTNIINNMNNEINILTKEKKEKEITIKEMEK